MTHTFRLRLLASVATAGALLAAPAAAQALCLAPADSYDAFSEMVDGKELFVGRAITKGAVVQNGVIGAPARLRVKARLAGERRTRIERVLSTPEIDPSTGEEAWVEDAITVHPGEWWLISGAPSASGRFKGLIATGCSAVDRVVNPDAVTRVRVGATVLTAGFSDLAGKPVLGTRLPTLPVGTRSLKVKGAEDVRLVRGGRLRRAPLVGRDRWSITSGQPGDAFIWLGSDGLWGVRLP